MIIQTFDEFNDFLIKQKFFQESSSRGRTTFFKTYNDIHADKLFPTLVEVIVDVFYSGENDNKDYKLHQDDEVFLVVWREFYEEASAKYNVFETFESLNDLSSKIQAMDKKYIRFPFPE